MTSAVDMAVEQQKDIGKAFREIADVRGDVKGVRGDIENLRTTIIGIDGKNGLRGELREFMKTIGDKLTEQDGVLGEIRESQIGQAHWKDQVETRFENYMRFERLATCHGKSALDKYLETIEQENVELRKQRMIGIFATVGAIIASGGGIIGTLIVTLGGK